MADSERERAETGKYVETVSLGRVLDAVASHPDPTVSAREVGEMLGCSTDAARKKLIQLHEDERIERKKVGGRSVVWWLADDASPAREERDLEDVIDALETFLDERDTPEPSLPSTSADGVHEDYHARRHRENMERLADDGS
jgi:predicted ArsR family transcriptional regulator